MARRVHNFSAGPAVLPVEVLQEVGNEALGWKDCGISIWEMSHRGEQFSQILADTENDLRQLLDIPSNYKVLFVTGGASGQSAAIPMNLLGDKKAADYIVTGAWGEKSALEAAKYCDVNVAASSKDENYSTIPDPSTWKLNKDAAYVHYTDNETIHGLEFDEVPNVGDVPLVCDMSSNIASRVVDISKFGLIYAGAQKNLGGVGVTVVIVREDLLGKALNITPNVWDYTVLSKQNSMFNTPPTASIYVVGKVARHLMENGGVKAAEEKNKQQSAKLYAIIDQNSEFYKCPVEQRYRSRMNIIFTLPNEELEAKFLKEAKLKDLVQLKGHRSVGGIRVSMYNSMPDESVDALCSFLTEFKNSQ